MSVQIPVEALLADDVVEVLAIRLAARSASMRWGWTDEQIRARWAELSEPVQSSFLAQARKDLTAIAEQVSA